MPLDDTVDFESDVLAVLDAQVRSALEHRYEFLAEMKRDGGMGIVYCARHRALDRMMAIKAMKPGHSRERFRKEAKLLAKVSSPYVVAIHDFDVLPNGIPVLVMDWVDGGDLHRVMSEQGGFLEESRVLPWMMQVCEGMQAASEVGIVHRDLKPSNILLNLKKQARVTDFGLARGPAGVPSLSLSSAILGTPYYMAPEQATDPRRVDSRADIYGFGATFYHALTGTPPFVGETAYAIIYKHTSEAPVPPRQLNPWISFRIGQILEHCLAKSPQDRFQSFEEVLNSLQVAATELRSTDGIDDEELSEFLSRFRSRRTAYILCDLPLGEPDVYRFPEGRTLRIVRGNIVEQEVDAIVSSDDEFLTMSGGVSRAIREAAGPEIESEARRFMPVQIGRVLVTSGGRLKARFVFHGITMGFREEGKLTLPNREVIPEIIAGCFYHADALFVEKIAFPLLGSGAFGLEEIDSLDVLSRAIARRLLSGGSTIREATIVLYKK